MKTKNLFLMSALMALLNWIPAGRVTAQTFTTLHSFTATTNRVVGGTNSDGAYPHAGLITNSSGNTLYGTASRGGSSGVGTVFALNTDGAGFTNVHNFAGPDGAIPYAGLVLSGNTLFGTATGGGFGAGTVFGVNTDGGGFRILWSFKPIGVNECGSSYDCSFTTAACAECAPGNNGLYYCYVPPGYCPEDTHGGIPFARLILSGDTLYGTARGGSYPDQGTVFAISASAFGPNYRQLYGFGSGSASSSPWAGLVLSGNTLYGTTVGTVFAVDAYGGDLRVVHSFTGSDGYGLQAGLVLSGNTLYGTARQGGSSGNGTVFALNTDGTGFTTLHSFTATADPFYTNTDGAHPQGGLILSGNTLFGTATAGGSSGKGTVFALNTDGTGFTNLYSFTACATNSSAVETNSDGYDLQAGLVLLGNTLYGTARQGGSWGNGTVFSLSFRPQLSITTSGTNVILSWPISSAGFDYTGYALESTTNLASPAVWSTNSPAPVLIAGQNVVTNPISGPQQFYRLVQ